MQFLDLAKIQIRSGSGGHGAASFRREKFVEFGGPDGGDGGDGGSVFIEAVSDLNTLIDFRYKRHVIAPDGRPGRGQRCHGARGKDITIKVPVGTEVLDESQSLVLFDLVENGQSERLAIGGKGGFGNRRFLSSTNQAPRKANPGQTGIELNLWLRLKLFADIGLLGLPNAGKSTFLGAVTRARPKVASYPFTTLHPMLGMVIQDETEIVIADIPGLIEGAHQGRGIGDRFLGHIERCQILIHLIDISNKQIVDDYHTIIEEIDRYGHGLTEKPRITLLSKADCLSVEEQQSKMLKLKEASGLQYIGCLSALTGEGVQDNLKRAISLVKETRDQNLARRERAHAWTP